MLAGGASASSAPGAASVGGELKPNSSAFSNIESAPTSTPSGANTVLHDCAKDCTKVPPQAESWALEISRPIRLFETSTGNVSDGLTAPASRPAVAVITLNVDPGGWGVENAKPATPRTSPLRASSTTTPPYVSPSAATAAGWMSGSIVVFTGLPRTGSALARIRSSGSPSADARSWPLGCPGRSELKASSSPLVPASVLGG